MEDSLILIPARGGSTRVKDKNIKMFGDKPLIAHIIEKALKSKCGRVVVSTDSPKIRDIALEYGAEVPFLRPDEFATTTATSLTPILHALQWFKENENWEPTYLLFTPATFPFTTVEAIRENKQKLIDAPEYINSAVTVCAPKTHPYSIVALDEENDLVKDGLVYYEGKNNKDVVRSQDYPKVYEMSANCTTTKVSFYKKLLEDAKGDISRVKYIRVLDDVNCVGNIVDAIESVDIDEPEDFEFALKLL
jgi:N-acylneuraminate cytidylyltransferase/CMP-N,N'-diacetyllegionaminic acid synthase